MYWFVGRIPQDEKNSPQTSISTVLICLELVCPDGPVRWKGLITDPANWSIQVYALPKHTRGTLKTVGAIFVHKVPHSGRGVSSAGHHQGGGAVPGHCHHWATVIWLEASHQLQTCIKGNIKEEEKFQTLYEHPFLLIFFICKALKLSLMQCWFITMYCWDNSTCKSRKYNG